jgi:hypothetical protein
VNLEPLTEEQLHVLEWLHECEGIEDAETDLRSGSADTLGELVLLGLAAEMIVDGELVGWIPSVKGYA